MTLLTFVYHVKRTYLGYVLIDTTDQGCGQRHERLHRCPQIQKHPSRILCSRCIEQPLPIGAVHELRYQRYRPIRLLVRGFQAKDKHTHAKTPPSSFNSYSWCDPNTFVGSGWSGFAQMYSNYSIPLFLSEYGCNTNPPRPFQEVQALYSTSEMASVYSGGLVYEYSEEADNPNVSSCSHHTLRNTIRLTFLLVRSRHRQLCYPGHAPYRFQQPPGHVQGQPASHWHHWHQNQPRDPALPSYVSRLASRW